MSFKHHTYSKPNLKRSNSKHPNVRVGVGVGVCEWEYMSFESSMQQKIKMKSLNLCSQSFSFTFGCLPLVVLQFVNFSCLMQTYLQSLTVRLEEWRLKRRDTEEWMRHRQLPQDLRERVRRFVQYKWLATRGVDEESILQALPTDLRRDIQRHLCLDLVRRVRSSSIFYLVI